MKSTTQFKSNSVLLAALAALSVLGAFAVPSAEAGNYRPARVACAPTYLHTCVVASHVECRWATDRCGRRYSYEVRVTTYADVYSDGSQRRYTRVG